MLVANVCSFACCMLLVVLYLLSPYTLSATIAHSGDASYVPAALTSNHRPKRGATAIRERLWPNATVPYLLDSRYTSKQAHLSRIRSRLVRNSTCAVCIPHCSWGYCVKTLLMSVYQHFSAGSEIRIIKRAMQHWEENTCVRFVPRTTEAAYVNIFPGSG